MNAEITAMFKNKIIKHKKNKDTGEPEDELLIQVEQKLDLPDGQIKFENYDIPVDISLHKNYTDKKVGDIVRVPCNIYASAVNANYATLGIGKAK